LKSSRADQELTAKINEAAKYHDIRLLDHIIVTRKEYCFFADEEASKRDEFKK
jgi:DNA repair protein RadC